MQKAYLQLEKSVKSLQQRKFLEKSMWVILQIDHKKGLSRGPAFKQEEEEEELKKVFFFFYRWLAISQNVVFNRALHMKNKIATVLKITKTKIKQSYELRKFHTSRGENEQLQKTSGAYVLSSRKKKSEKPYGWGVGGGGGGGGGGGNHPPCTSEG